MDRRKKTPPKLEHDLSWEDFQAFADLCNKREIWTGAAIGDLVRDALRAAKESADG